MNKQVIKQFLKQNYKYIILFVCLIIFLDFVLDIFNNEIMKEDVIGYNMISKYLMSDSITPIAKFITNLGGATFLIIFSLIISIIIFFQNKKISLSIILNLIIITLLNLLLKNIVQRPRPIEFKIIEETGYSFPSGHSMISMAFYGYLIFLIYKYIKNRYIKIVLITLLCILIFLIGISRIYLGVHYTSDVLSGFLISIAYLIVYTSIINKVIIRREKNEN